MKLEVEQRESRTFMASNNIQLHDFTLTKRLFAL